MKENISKKLMSYLNYWDIAIDEIDIDTFSKEIDMGVKVKGVTLELKNEGIMISCYNQKNQQANLSKCLDLAAVLMSSNKISSI